jgi:hypothetical protein
VTSHVSNHLPSPPRIDPLTQPCETPSMRFGFVALGLLLAALPLSLTGCWNKSTQSLADGSGTEAGSEREAGPSPVSPDGPADSPSSPPAPTPDAGLDAPPADTGPRAPDAGGPEPSGPACPMTTPQRCPAGCVDVLTDRNNCGTCGNECSSHQRCVVGRCSPGYESTAITGSISGTVWSVAVAGDGGFFVGGVFKGTVDFDPGPAEARATALAGGDVFVTRYMADGTYLWTRTMPGTDDPQWVNAALSPDGGVVLSGFYKGTTDFFPGQAGASRTTFAGGGDEGYVLKISGEGNFAFLRTFPAQTGYSVVYRANPAADGSVVVAGAFYGPVDFGGGRGEPFAGGGFLVKLSPSGATTWSRLFLSKDLPAGGITQAAVAKEGPNGSVWVAGTFAGKLDLDPGAATREETAMAGQALFAVRLGASGDFMGGAATAMGASSIIVRDVAVTHDGAGYVTGEFVGGSVIQGPPAAPMPRPNAGDRDGFVARFAPGGGYQWGHGLGSPGLDFGTTVAATADGGVLLAGGFAGSVDFAPAPPADRREASAGALYVTRLGPDRSYGGTFTLKGPVVSTLRADPVGFHLAGSFVGSADFNPHPTHTDNKASVGGAAFVSRYIH